MKRNSIFLSLILLASQLLYAGEQIQNDKWLALLRYANIQFDEVKKQCPHFPFYDANTKDETFRIVRSEWQAKYGKEVTSFLAIDKIKKLNPSLVDLEIKKLGEESPRKFENSYWNWVEASAISRASLTALAPHFPIPVVTEDLDNAEAIYQSAIEDWMILFPQEVSKLFNNEALVKLNPYHNSNPNYKVVESKLSFLALKTPTSLPTAISYYSGNELLDQARVLAYSKKWYWEQDRKSYYELYDPAGLAEYSKHLEYLDNTTIDKEIKY